MGLFSFLFGKNNSIKDFLENNALILDVRTEDEYNSNHITDAIHIPISELKSRIEEIKALNQPVIAHCASGIRSAQAVQILKANGIEAINGGGIAAMRKALEQ